MKKVFYKIYGIMDEKNIKGNINTYNIHCIFGVLNMMDYYPHFLHMLSPDKELSSRDEVSVELLFSVMNSNKLLLLLPLRSNDHPTYINIMILRSAFILYLKHILSYSFCSFIELPL